MLQVASNWKLNKGPNETATFFEKFEQALNDQVIQKNQFHFFVSASNWQETAKWCEKIISKRSIKLSWGGQNCFSKHQGAFTGENSAAVLKDLGGTDILVGHSERRAIFQESNQLLNEKILSFTELGLSVMYCIGETLTERETGKTNEVLTLQLDQGLKNLSQKNKVLIAYEPVWAIGTGKVATTQQISETHLHVRKELSRLGFGHDTNILYGGSVKPENSQEIGVIQNVSGFLVGGASLEVDSLLKICK